jgi:hypothetical protein
MEEETKSVVARMVDLCQSCSDDDFCKECREDIQFFQEQADFDVTDYITLSVPEDLQPGSTEAPEPEEEVWLQVTAYEHTVYTPENGRETVLSYNEDDTQLDEDLEILGTNELATKREFHLWLADLKKELDFDNQEQDEGARKLVEQAAFNLGTHGRKILQEELEEGED